jgi:hypothetical protein
MEVDDAIGMYNLKNPKILSNSLRKSIITQTVVPGTTYTILEPFDTTMKDLGLILAVMPHNYPLNSFSYEDTNALQTHIEDMIDNIADGSTYPKFSSSINEFGYWRVSCVDEFTRQWFLDAISNFMVNVQGSNEPLKVSSINDMKKYTISFAIPADTSIDIDESSVANKIINLLHKSNPGLDISKWNGPILEKCTGGYAAKLELDAGSLKQIMDNNSCLNFENMQLKINVG